MTFLKIIKQFKYVNLREFSLKFENCSLCNWKLQIKINNDEMSVRCTRCFASAVTQSMGFALKKHIVNLKNLDIYELSSRGAFVRFLKIQKANLTLSEFFDDVKIGTQYKGTICQNVENLTFEDESFNICTSLEVFEHVKDDCKGFKEIYRVLKRGGYFIFTVPIDLKNRTIERTQIKNGTRENILEPEYHSDNLRGKEKVFCYRNYGHDILQRLHKAGFEECTIEQANQSQLFGFSRPVIIALKS